jgi:hypothetical protein
LSGYDSLSDDIFDFVSFASDAKRSYIFIDEDGTGIDSTLQTAVRLDYTVVNADNFNDLVTDGTIII